MVRIRVRVMIRVTVKPSGRMYQTKPLDPVEVTPLEYTLTLSKFQYIQWSIIIELSGNSIELEAFCPMYLKHFASWNQCE